jgi:hypothetical protein
MNEIESCTQESIGKGRKKVAGARKIARMRKTTRREKITRKLKGNGKKT